MRIIPLELRDLNTLVASLHRHHKPVQGHRFSIGVEHGGKVVGGASIGRPTARMTPANRVLEVTRLVTDGSKNACSALYSAAARVGKELGYERIQTFVLATEPGTSLRAAGWVFDGESGGGDWTRASKPNRRQDQPQGPKHRWVRQLNAERGMDATEQLKPLFAYLDNPGVL
jgi:hypothetical protein